MTVEQLGDFTVERALAGAVLIDPARVLPATGALRSADFVDDLARRIVDTVTIMFATGTPVDQITVADRLGDVDVPTLSALMYSPLPSVSAAAHYVAIIRRRARHRRLVLLSGDLGAAALAEDDDEIARLIDALVDLADKAST